MAAMEVFKLLSVKPLPGVVTAMVSLSLFLPVCALSSTPSVQTLRKEVVILDRARRTVRQELGHAGKSGGTTADSSRYLRYLEERISSLCGQVISIGGPSMVTDLPCPAAASLLPGYETPASRGYEGRVRDMDRQLLESLGNFDEMLAAEQQKVQARRPEAAGSAPGEPGASSQGARGEGSGTGRYGGGISGEGGRSAGATDNSSQGSGNHKTAGPGGMPGNGQFENGKNTKAAGRTPGSQTGSAQDHSGPYGPGSRQAASQDAGRPGQPGTIAGTGDNSSAQGNDSSIYEDDDIVARQIREAAEKETDPELKKKLWEEYRRYKESSR